MGELKLKIKKIMDRPLDKKDENLFIDRREEMLKIENLVDYFEGGIVGIAGERGIGKTSMFNLIRFPGKEKLLINIVDRENRESIISNIMEGIREYSEKKGWISISKRLEKVIRDIMPLTRIKLDVIEIKGEYKKTFRSILKEFSNLMEEISKKNDIVVILDEIDKEKKEEILLVIDSIKDAFKNNKTTLLIALPYTIYEEVIRSNATAKETYNLENVFDYVVLIPPLSEQDLEEIIENRLGSGLIEEEAKRLVIEYARGNPRRLIRTIKEAGMIATDKIRLQDVNAVLKKYIDAYIDYLKLDKRKLKIIKLISKGVKKAEDLSKKMRLSIPSIYREISRLKEVGVIDDNMKLTKEGELISRFIK